VRLPYLDFDIDFLLTNGHVTVARLNEFSETIKMSPRDFSLTLLFDGTTTTREAERFIFGSKRGKGMVDDLISQVVRAGFGVTPTGKAIQ
jgi:hypothetical protein